MVILKTHFEQRTLRKNHIKRMPRRMIFLDVETERRNQGDHELHRLKLAWACYLERRSKRDKDTETWETFDGTYPLCRFIERHAYPETALYIFGHNIFFDLQSSDFFYYFTRWGWALQFVYDSQLTYILVIRKEKSTIRIISTTNLFPGKLKELGELIGIPKIEIDLDEADPETLSVYCRRDVEIIKKAMERYFDFVADNDLSKFSMTRASQAFNAFRHKFMGRKIYIHHDEEVQALEHQAYIGGRTEAFFLGQVERGPFVSLDVNSMYPHVMRTASFPVKLLSYREEVPEDLLRDILKKSCVVAEVDLDTPDPIYAVRKEDKLIFPTGRFTAFLCTPAMETALKRGHIIRVKKLASYQADAIFIEWVDELYALRRKYAAEKNRTYEKLIKTMLNSLYGKFAQVVPRQTEQDSPTGDGYYRLETIDLRNGEVEIEYKLFNKIIRVSGSEPAKTSFIAISAHITEWARMILWKIIEQVGYGRVLYCDTDSVKIRKADLPLCNYPLHPTDLGCLKVDNEFSQFEIRGAKSYITEKDRVLKGIPKDAVEISPYVYEFASFLGQRTHMKEEINRAFKVGFVRREARPHYDKGVVRPDGTVVPFNLSEF